jgi:hypothetical protein
MDILTKTSGRRLRKGCAYLKIQTLVLLCYIIFACCACKKNNPASVSKFRTQQLKYTATFFTNSVKLSNGNYVTIDQDTSYRHINIGAYDVNFNLVFLKKYSFSTPRDISCCIQFGNGFLITGFNNDNSALFAIMFNADGTALWDSTYTPPGNNKIHAVSCCTGTDGNILLVASSQYGNGNTVAPPFIAKINPQSGSMLSGPFFINGIDSLRDYWVTSVYERNDGLYMSGFYFFLSGGSWDQGSLICLKTTEDGNILWLYSAPVPPANTNLTGNPYVNAYNIAETNNGPVVLTAITTEQFSSASVYYFNNYWYPMIGNICVYSFNPLTGAKTDSVTFDINNKTTYPIIHPTYDGGFIIAATGNNFLSSFTAPTTVLLIKTDAQFNIQWQKTYYPVGNNYIVLGVFPLADGYEVMGQNNSIINSESNVSTFLMKTDMQGNLRD